MSNQTKDVDPALVALYGRPGFMLRRAHQIAVSMFMEENAALGVTTTQYGVMVLLRARAGIDQAALARLMGLDRSTTGLVVGKLEAAGYVERASGIDDRRRKTLKLTRAGAAVLRRIAKPAVRASERLLEPFNAREKKVFMELLARFVETHNSVVRTPLEAE
jgi:MarR family transcriptional regulator, lower aerobic nicotinate degradation pathway regulator